MFFLNYGQKPFFSVCMRGTEKDLLQGDKGYEILVRVSVWDSLESL